MDVNTRLYPLLCDLYVHRYAILSRTELPHILYVLPKRDTDATVFALRYPEITVQELDREWPNVD